MAVRLTVLVILIIYSRLSELIAVALGFNIYLVLILASASFVLMVPTGGLARSLLTKPGAFLTLFTVWLLFITPFSVWKGGSVALLKDYWSKSYVLYLILAGLLVSLDHCRKALYAIGAAAVLVEVFALLEQTAQGQRLTFSFGSFANPNDLSFYLAFSLPGCVLLVLNSKPFGVLRTVGLASAALICLLVFRTGSRMGLIMILVALLFLFFTVSLANKVKLLAAAMVLGALALVTTGRSVVERYGTILSDSPQSIAEGELGKAQGSTYARKNLLKASLIITMRNPLVGVGPGMFNVAASDDPYLAKVLFAAWHETHNTYTQVSSETGIPGLLIFGAILISVFGTLVRVWRQTRKSKDMEQYFRVAYCLMLMLLVYLVGAMFGSSAYNFFLPTLAGLTAALGNVVREEVLFHPLASPTSSAGGRAVEPARPHAPARRPVR